MNPSTPFSNPSARRTEWRHWLRIVDTLLTEYYNAADDMKIKYFDDTDTALLEFNDREVFETREISENVYVDLDIKGNPVSMTIEHARENANLREVTYQQVERVAA